jgi:hypothetical protein
VSVTADPGLDQGQLLDTIFRLRDAELVVSDELAKSLIQCSNEGEYSVYQCHLNVLEDGVHVSLVNDQPLLSGNVRIWAELSEDEGHMEWTITFQLQQLKVFASSQFNTDYTLVPGNEKDRIFAKSEIHRALRQAAQRALKSYIS